MIRASLVVLLIATLISGCGFKLRGLEGDGGERTPLPFQELRVVLNVPNVRLNNLLEQALKRDGVNVTTDAELHLIIDQFRQTRRTVALNSAAKAAEYELQTSAVFYLFTKQRGTVSKSATVTVLRNYSNDPDQVTGKLEEERLLQDEMLREVVSRIMQRLQSMEVAQDNPPSHPTSDTTQLHPADDKAER